MKLRLSLIILSALCAKTTYAETERVVVQAEVEMSALPADLRQEIQDELNKDVDALRRKYESVEGVECTVASEEMDKSGCCKPKPCCNKPCCCKDMELDQDQDNMDV